MFFYDGLGFLVPVVTIVTMAAVQTCAGRLSGNHDYYGENDWVKYVAIGLAAAMNYLLYRVLEKRQPKPIEDPASGEIIQRHIKHTFFFIPVKWWPAMVILFGCLAALGLFDE